MNKHYSPTRVAAILARHFPRQIQTILEPSVGAGALLQPVIKRLIESKTHTVCVDRDRDALDGVRRRFRNSLGASLQLVHADFLDWEPYSKNAKLKSGFDCVVMNPPFNGRKNCLRQVCYRNADGQVLRRFAPVEGAFLLKAVSILRPGGRLLSVLPCSVIAGSRCLWIRRFLLENGHVKRVYELPRFTFPELEARVYLLVFEKSHGDGRITLSNGGSLQNNFIEVASSSLGEEVRFDFAYQMARAYSSDLQGSTCRAKWVPLASIAKISRGKSLKGSKVVHTSSYNNGFWDAPSRLARESGFEGKDLNDQAEIFMGRVGRMCPNAIGLAPGIRARCSDCIIRLEPKMGINSSELLFSLRCFLTLVQVSDLLLRGIGASYLTERDLGQLHIPSKLHDVYPRLFASYRTAIRLRNFEQMCAIEQAVQADFAARAGLSAGACA